MTWFAKASTNILNLHLIVVVHSILVGLCPRIFLDSLYVEPPVNTNALQARQ